MRGAATSSCTFLLLLALPLLSEGAPATSGVCGHGCLCYHLPEGGRAANCSRFEIGFHGNHVELPTDLRSLRVLPNAPGLTSFLEERLSHHARHLEELYLADNEVVGTRLWPLRSLHKLQVLDLSFCDVSNADQIAPLVKHSGSLERLRLSGNALASLPALSSDTLTDLDVSDCDIASVRADAFARLRRLHRLNLARNRLTNLAADLPHSLRFLDLSGNSLTHLSPKVVSRLHRVDVSGNPLHCTCALLRLRDQRKGDHVVVGAGAACTGPEQLRGLTLSGARRLCESHVRSATRARPRRQADPLDMLEGSGDDADDGVGVDEELDEDNGDDFADDDYDEEIDGGTGTGGADDVHELAPPDTAAPQLGLQNVGLDSTGSSSLAPPVPALHDETTRSLEDDIYEPTVPPPVPAAVDADADAGAAAQPPSEIPPESGPPVAETVQGHAESSVDESGDVDGIHEPSEHKEESEPVAAVSVPHKEVGEENDGKEDEANKDVDDVFNEVMKSEDEDEAVDNNEDYDYDEEMESATDEISNSDYKTLDIAKEGAHEIPLKDNETLALSSETVDKKTTLDTTFLTQEEDSDKDYDGNETDVEEKENEVESADNAMAVHANVATAGSTEKPPSSDTAHSNLTSDSVILPHDGELHENNEDSETDVEFVEEPDGSGEGNDDDSVPVGPITGFMDTNGHDGAATTEEPDEGALVIDEGEETEESNTPLIPPGVDDVSETLPTDEKVVSEADVKFAVVGNGTKKETSINAEDDGEEEGSGMPNLIGDGDGEVEKANETDNVLGQSEIHEDDLIVQRISPVESGREMSSSESPVVTSTSEKPVAHGRLFRFNLPGEEAEGTSETPTNTVMPVDARAGGVSSSTAHPEGDHPIPAEDRELEVVEEPIVTAAPVPVVEAVPSGESVAPPAETSPPSPPVLTSELPVKPDVPEWGDGEASPRPEPEDIDQDQGPDVETVGPTGDTPYNDTARVVVAGSEKPPEETPLNSAGSYVVLGIIMALVVFLLGYAVMRSRRGRQRAAAKANGKDAEAAGGQQEGRELKEISKPLLGTPATVPAANGKGEHLQPLVTKPADNPDLKDDDGDERVPDKPLLEPKTHIYETLNSGEKERVPVHQPSPKKSPSMGMPAAGSDSGDAVDSRTPPVPEKRRVLSRLPETVVDGAPNMYTADGLPGEVVAQPQHQQPTANGAATSPVNGLSTFAPPVSPSSGRVKVVAREDPDSVPKKPVFVVNQGPSATSGIV